MKSERIEVRYLGGLGSPITVTLRRPNRSVTFDLTENPERLLEPEDARDLCRQRGYFAELVTREAFNKRFNAEPPRGSARFGDRIALTRATLGLLRLAPRATDDEDLPEELRRLLKLEGLDFRTLKAVARVFGLKATGKAEKMRLSILERWPEAEESQRVEAEQLIRSASDA